MKGQLDVKTPRQYLAALKEPRKSDVARLDRLIRSTVPAFKPFILKGMLGYGRYQYRYPSGREGEWCRVAVASNASYVSLYVMAADANGYVAERYRARLPKARIGKSCVTFKRFDDLDPKALRALLKEAHRLARSSRTH
jgi:hypothetical protein